MTPTRRVRILVSSGVLVVLLLAAVFRGPLLGALIVLVLRQRLGLHATIAQVEGNVATGLVLQGVSARGEAGAGPLASLDVRRISARYALAALLRGKAAFLDALDVSVDGARIDLDLTGPNADGPQPGAGQAGLSSLPRLPRLTVSDSRVLVRGRGFTLEADGLRASVARADQAREQALEIRVERLSPRHPALRDGTISLAIAGRIAPRRLVVTSARVDGETLVQTASYTLGERPGEVDLQLALGLWQGSVEIGMLRRAAGTEVRWDARGIDLQPGLVLSNPALGALRGRLSTNGAARLGGGGLPTLTGRLALDWTGALIAGRAVDHLQIEGAAEPGVVRVERVEGRIGPNTVALHRVALATGPLFEARWRALLAASSGAFSVSLGDLPAFLALWGVEAGAVGGAVPGQMLHLEGSLEHGVVRLARGDLVTGLGTATLAGVTITFPREEQGWGETAFSGGAVVDVPNLRDAAALFSLPSLSGSLRGEISGAGTFARPEGSVSLTGRGVSAAGRLIGDVDLKAHGAAGRIAVETLEVRRGESRVTARDVRFSPAALASSDFGAVLESLTGSFSLSSADVPGLAALAGAAPEVAARIPAKHLLSIAGTVQGRAIAVAEGSFAAAGGSIVLRTARVVVPGAGGDWKKDTTLAGELAVDLPDLGPLAAIFQLPPLRGSLGGRAWVSGSTGAPGARVDIAGRGIAVDGHRVGDVVVRGELLRQGVKLETLEVTRGEDRLRGHGSYDLEKRQLLEAEADLSLADVAPYLAEFVREGIAVSGRFHVALRAAGSQPGTPLAVGAEFSAGRVGSVRDVQGTAAAQVSFPDALQRPRFSVTSRVTGTSGSPEARPVRAALDATYEPGLLRIGAFELSGAGGLVVKGEGAIPVDLAAQELLSPGPISFQAQANIPALEELAALTPSAYALTGALRAAVGVSGSWKEPEARLELHGERLQLPPGTPFAPPGPHTLSGILTWGEAGARAERVRLASPALTCTLSGAWRSPPSPASLFAGAAAAATGSLALRATFAVPDIGWLRESVVGLQVLRGSLSGEIAVDGPVNDPALSGEIRIAGGAVRYEDLPPIDTLAARATVAGRRVTLKEFGGNLGGSPFTLAGTVDYSLPANPVLDLRLEGKNILLYRDEGLRVRADSDLTLRGPVSALVLAGEVALTNSLYQKDITVASLFSGGDKTRKRATPGLAGISFPEPPLRDMRFDVRLTAREPFQIKTTVVRGAARPDLRLTGTGLLPILRGPILVDDALVLLPSGTLQIEHGTVLMRESDPNRPALDFGGRMQALGYEITAQVGGTLETPEVVLSSIPPLPREELLLFVVTGAPPGSVGADGGSIATMASPMATYLGKNVLGQLLGGGTRAGKSGIQDRIELQIGRELTRSGSVTLDARLLLNRNPLGGGSALYVTSEKDIYDQYNAGLKILFKFK